MEPVCQPVEVVVFVSLLLIPGKTAGVQSCQSQKFS